MFKNRKVIIAISFVVIVVFSYCFLQVSNTNRTTNAILTSTETLSNSKIKWGIKRAQNNEQPDLGEKNLELLTSYSRNSYGK